MYSARTPPDPCHWLIGLFAVYWLLVVVSLSRSTGSTLTRVLSARGLVSKRRERDGSLFLLVACSASLRRCFGPPKARLCSAIHWKRTRARRSESFGPSSSLARSSVPLLPLRSTFTPAGSALCQPPRT